MESRRPIVANLRRLALLASGVICLLAGCLSLPRVEDRALPDGLLDAVRVDLIQSATENDHPPLTPAIAPVAHRAPRSPELTLSLSEAIARAILANPRLLVFRAGIDRAQGNAEVAFAPFLPEVDLLSRAGVTTPTLSPGAPGIVGAILGDRLQVPYTFAQSELQIQWTLHDFGRTAGRYGQAVSRERIASLRYNRARETVAFDAAAAYLEGLQTRAIRTIQLEAIRQADAILEDTRARQEAGTLLRDAVLRAEVQRSESREALLVAEEAELAALARLDNVLGRNGLSPVQLIDRQVVPPLGLSLVECLEKAVQQRQEVAIAREAIAEANQGRQAAAAEFCPRLYLLAGMGYVDGEHILGGWQAGSGIHLNQPLYKGGKRQGELHAADGAVQEALARSRVLLDAIGLEVKLAYQAACTNRQRIDLSRPAVTQAEENLRLVRVRYDNGNATPTEIVDAQTALTRSRQRLASAIYQYQIALARLDHVLGNPAGFLLEPGEKPQLLSLPRAVSNPSAPPRAQP